PPTGDGAGVLERDAAGEAEHPEQAAQVLVRGVHRFGTDVGEHLIAVADALVLLRVIAERHAVPEAELARVRGRNVREDLEEARLPGTVQTHDQQSLPPGQVEPDALEDRRATVALGEPLGLERNRPRPR